jgi:hypothetical protein
MNIYYKEGFYRLRKNKKRIFKRILPFLIFIIVIFFLLHILTSNRIPPIIGYFEFDESLIRAPVDGIFRKNINDLEKVRVGQIIGYMDTINKKIEQNISYDKKYMDLLEEINKLGDKINLKIDEIRIKVFNNDFKDIEEDILYLKSVSEERLKIFNNLKLLEENVQKNIKRIQGENYIFAIKSGYISFFIDNLIDKNLNEVSISELNNVKYNSFSGKRVKKGDPLCVIRELPPKSLILFSKSSVEPGRYIIIETDFPSKNLVKTKVLKVEFLKIFYKLTTLPLEFNNIILKERIIKGKILKIY